MADKPNKDYLVWMDLEMTGLDAEQDVIIEIATIITNKNLEIIEEGPALVIHQDPNRFQKMDKWNQEHHTKSGLWQAVVNSTVTVQQAEDLTHAFLKKHVPANEIPLCGNSIWQDRRFLQKYMPKVHEYLHYRIVDISTVKELALRWYPETFKKYKKKEDAHRALDDTKESIKELKFYREQFFKN